MYKSINNKKLYVKKGADLTKYGFKKEKYRECYYTSSQNFDEILSVRYDVDKDGLLSLTVYNDFLFYDDNFEKSKSGKNYMYEEKIEKNFFIDISFTRLVVILEMYKDGIIEIRD